jgi:hypothetical protein
MSSGNKVAPSGNKPAGVTSKKSVMRMTIMDNDKKDTSSESITVKRFSLQFANARCDSILLSDEYFLVPSALPTPNQH